jgi:ABC-type transporter Mla maintaining outer membrane lipid asymmetry permease subunit MlaE
MKKTIIILVILGLSVSIYSQNMNTESVLEIYNQTFLDFFSNKAKHTESKEFFIAVIKTKNSKI